jgi:flagellar basal-body rod protein FlgC
VSEIGLIPGVQIAGSGLSAQRARLDVISSNIANASTTRTETGEPYRRQMVELVAPSGVRVPRHPLTTPATRLDVARTHPEHKPGPDPLVLFRTLSAGIAVGGIVEDETPFPVIYDPSHPDADEQGFVRMPNVELLDEMVDLMIAARTYEANLRSLEAAREMAARTLDALAT